MTPETTPVVRGTILLVLGIVMAIAFAGLTIRKAEDPARMAFKWVLTVIIGWVMFWKVAPVVARGGYEGAFFGVPAAAVCGLALAIVWRHQLAALIAQPFASLYDGGSLPPEPRPAYSVALARQKQGKYLEAVAEIRQQLNRFPADLEGQMLLAQIQAQDLKDMLSAEITIQQFCAQPGHAPANIAFALYSLADWRLKISSDREAARGALQQIITLLPDTEFALTAAQRIAHLGDSPGIRAAALDGKKFEVTAGVQNLGLLKSLDHLKPAEMDPAQAAAGLVEHLDRHPQDTEAREKLAVLYADHYGRLDFATMELEQMIGEPARPAKLQVRWLNLLADLQVRSGVDHAAIKSTLERIIDLDPDLAAAEAARKRIGLLKLELKGKQATPGVKLGTYEQNIGLKRGRSIGPASG